MARSSFYQSHHKVESELARENRVLTQQISRIHADSKGRYGPPKIHQTLLTNGFELSLKRVQRLMKKAGIQSNIQKKYTPYSSSKNKVEERENVLEQDFTTPPLMKSG
ncbi:hypothetical protein J6TS2_49010 [Heyndrickxia sporothermodurans]|nr:hypothetical protein J6TS2_49010 [Heyndrickxia sporothermodurans]